MTVELITGTPGAGKTTFAVAKRIAVEARAKVRVDDETCIKLGLELGTVVDRRLVVAGVRGLKIDHERLPHVLTRDSTPAADVEKWNAIDGESPVHQRLPGDPARDVPAIAQNWWLWCKPGDLIVIDEAQFMAPRGTLGRKPPYWVQALEIHRHYGVDFIFITQHPGLIDPTIRALVGLHRHVRSVMGSSMCMVYVWDHASNPERYTNANKETFLRRAKHYALFHSSVAHIKPPTSGRKVAWMFPLLIALAIGCAMRLSGRFQPHKPDVTADGLLTSAAAATPASAPSFSNASMSVPHAGVQGCYTVGDRCSCTGAGGMPVAVGPATCRLSAAGYDGIIRWSPRPDPLPGNYGAQARSVDYGAPVASQPLQTTPSKPLVF